MEDRVCDRWGTQTTAIDIAEQTSEVTVPPPGGGGRLQGGEISGGGGTTALPLNSFPPSAAAPIGPSPPCAPPRPTWPILPYPNSPPFPMGGCANGASGLSLFHCFAPGPHEGGRPPSPLTRCVRVHTPNRRWGAPPQRRRVLGPTMCTCGGSLPRRGHKNNLPLFYDTIRLHFRECGPRSASCESG